MSMRIHYGIDPGLSGSISVFKDGEPSLIFDMPTVEVRKWAEVDGKKLAEIIRTTRSMHAGAAFSACIEKVGARPGDGGTSAFRFGEGYGKVKAVFETLGIPYSLVVPAVWKRRFCLIGTEKDAARVLAITRFPSMANQLKRKKDGGRADSLWIGLYHEQTQHA